MSELPRSPSGASGSAVRYPLRPDSPPRRAEPPPIPFLRPALAPLDLAELAALDSLPLRARRLADAVGVGQHRSRRKGASIEFADYRDYQSGDDLRRIDWRLYGRTDRLQIRDAHEDTPLRVVLLLDVSHSMSFSSRAGLLTKLDYARSLLGAVALVTRRQRDACGLGIVADDLVRFVPPSGSPARLRTIWGALESPPLASSTALASALGRVADILPASCLVVLASDFYEDPSALESVARRLRFDRHDVLALHLIDPVEEEFPFTDPAEFADVESAARLQLDPVAAARNYRAAFTAHRAALLDAFQGCGFDYLPMRTDASPLVALAAYLARRSGRH